MSDTLSELEPLEAKCMVRVGGELMTKERAALCTELVRKAPSLGAALKAAATPDVELDRMLRSLRKLEPQLRREVVTPQERRAARVRGVPWPPGLLALLAIGATLVGYGEAGMALSGLAFGLTFK